MRSPPAWPPFLSPKRYGLNLRWPPLGVDPARALHSAPFIAAAFLVAWPLPRLRPLAWGLLFHRIQDELYGAVVVPETDEDLEK